MLYAQDILDDLYQMFDRHTVSLAQQDIMLGMTIGARSLKATGNYRDSASTVQIGLFPHISARFSDSEMTNEFRISGVSVPGYWCHDAKILNPPDGYDSSWWVLHATKKTWDFDQETRSHDEVLKEIFDIMHSALTFPYRAGRTKGSHDFCNACPRQLTCVGETANGS